MILLVLLAGCRLPEAQPGELPGGREITGVWLVPAVEDMPEQRVHFFPDGNFVVDEGLDGTIEHVGRWTVEDAERLVVVYWEWAEICPLLPGAYRFEIRDDTLYLGEILDECESRRLSWSRPMERLADE